MDGESNHSSLTIPSGQSSRSQGRCSRKSLRSAIMAPRGSTPTITMKRFVRTGDSLDLLRLGISHPHVTKLRQKRLNAMLNAILTILEPAHVREYAQVQDLGRCGPRCK